jgi:glutathione synthase/RimK-type ligase-like ATP-grasp enzyme
MKKVGLLFGRERSFPTALIGRINQKSVEGIMAEPVLIDKVIQGKGSEYSLIVDRISQDVPFYRSFLKDAALSGTAVVNNPFWWSADDKFFNISLALKLGINVPKTVLLPSKDHPYDTSEASFSNLAYPLDWEGIFDYVGFPAYLKPFEGKGLTNVYRLEHMEDFFIKHPQTGTLVMLLQEEIVYEEYYRCYCIGGERVHIMAYEPLNTPHLRYQRNYEPKENIKTELERIVRSLNKYLGYDFNAVEIAIRNGVPYVIDYCNPAPDADLINIGEENFEWIVENTAQYCIERAQKIRAGKDNLTWGDFLKKSMAGASLE